MGTALTTKDLLALAAEPLGSRNLQKEAERIGCRPELASEDLRQICKRVSKKWLPLGKRSISRHEAQVAEQALYGRQIDIEDAIEQAGGQRGMVGKP